MGTVAWCVLGVLVGLVIGLVWAGVLVVWVVGRVMAKWQQQQPPRKVSL